MESLDKDKIVKALEDLEKKCRKNTEEYWGVAAILCGVHEGLYDFASSDIEPLPISEKLDDIKDRLDKLIDHFGADK